MIRIKIENNKPESISLRSKIHNYMMFGSGVLLAISESLPFMTDIKANGILDSIKKIRTEYKSLE
jgi:hypothetical protein